jgi:L-2,4-diaminobutyric acid acetyltransferase
LPDESFIAADSVIFRKPRLEDGPAVTALIAACPPLDTNSAYCNLLQCSHFADSCIIAERDGELVGWISGYRLPQDASRFFVWQVAVSPAARGEGLGGRMIDGLLARPEARGVTHIVTSVTRGNDASRAMFRGWARRHAAAISESELFSRDRHFAGNHDTEWQLEIGPFALS